VDWDLRLDSVRSSLPYKRRPLRVLYTHHAYIQPSPLPEACYKLTLGRLDESLSLLADDTESVSFRELWNGDQRSGDLGHLHGDGDGVLCVCIRRYKHEKGLSLVVDEAPAGGLELLAGTATRTPYNFIPWDIQTVDGMDWRPCVQTARNFNPLRLSCNWEGVYLVGGEEKVGCLGGLLTEEILCGLDVATRLCWP